MRTYVYKDQNHYWFCNTAEGAIGAQKAISTALVARDLAPIGASVKIEHVRNEGSSNPEEDGFKVYRTVKKFRPKGATPAWPSVGNLVEIIRDDNHSGHGFPGGAVVEIVDPPNEDYARYLPEGHVYARGPATWAPDDTIVNHLSPLDFVRTDATETTADRIANGEDPYDIDVAWDYF